MELTNWGNYPRIHAKTHELRDESQLAHKMTTGEPLIPRGLGRCYGDSSLAANVVSTLRWNRLLHFEDSTGTLHCEAGVSFADILEVFVPKGWFLPVTPGTRFITVGGAIAADVHGKNHHLDGSFSRHLHSFRLLTGTGSILNCSPQENSTLFHATCGGMGLTGIILDAIFSLRRIETAYIVRRRCRFNSLDAVMDAFAANSETTYSVAWIDGLATGQQLGRSVLHLGEHARLDQLPQPTRDDPFQIPQKRKLTVPFHLPSFALNTLSIKLFNSAIFHLAPKNWREDITSYDPFFYPLDHIYQWNRCYGRRGFTQYQFVLPLESSRAGLIAILKRIARSGSGSFLSVLKLFGKQDGVLAFPREGYTLAMDFPIKQRNLKLLDELDSMVLDHGGRHYLAKDSRMKAITFRQSYNKLKTFLETKTHVDPHGKLASLQSERLGVTK